MSADIPGMDPELMILIGSGTLSPLPPQTKDHIIIMGMLALFSFLSCALLFTYITYRRLRPRWSSDADTQALGPHDENPSELVVLDPVQRQPGPIMIKKSTQDPEGGTQETTKSESDPDSNPFLTLIHNLLAADLIQAIAFMLSLTWWRQDGIFVPSSTCVAQGFFIILGSNSISAFLVAISLNTMFTIVWDHKLSKRAVRGVACLCWLFSFTLAFSGLGISGTVSEQDEGWFFARSMSLCWVNKKYASRDGFWLQNFWIILSIAITIFCYLWILVAYLQNKQSTTRMPPSKSRDGVPRPSGHHPAFLIYPVIYIICSAPISLVGLMAAAGVHVTEDYFESVAIISSMAGLLDAILWSTTILFSSSKGLEESGLAKYNFVRTPERVYGNMVWVEGATRSRNKGGSADGQDTERKWWKLSGNDGRQSRTSQSGSNNDEDGIHLDTVTMVTVDYMEPGNSGKNSAYTLTTKESR